MINYTAWRPPRYESATEPAVLTTSQRRVFWGIVRGMSLVQLADEFECSLRTIQAHNISIHERIPGLLNFAAYGLLAAEIMRGRDNDSGMGISIQSAAEDSATRSRKPQAHERGTFP